MDTGLTRPSHGTRLKRELSREAISLALNGEWERATEVNRAILELFTDDVEAMNRLGKALMELSRYSEAKDVLGRVVQVAPYNGIAKKNLTRLTSLESAPASNRQARKAGGPPQLFIEESGKSGTTVLRKMAKGHAVARIAPSDPATLAVENNAVNVYSKDGDYLGQIEPKLGQRLVRLMCDGNKYDAAVIRVNDQGIALIIRETYRHRSLQHVCSFPSRTKEEHRVYLGESLVRYIRDEDLEDEDEEESVIDEEEIETEWGDNE
jgi:hypothetical protein